MSNNSKRSREIAIFVRQKGAPAPNGSTREHIEGKPEACDGCAGDNEGLVLGRTITAPASMRALPGSKEAGCKLVDLSLIEGLGDGIVPACFHLDRFKALSHPARTVETSRPMAGSVEVPLQALNISTTELFTGGEQRL